MNKRCSKCGKEYPATSEYFHKTSRKYSGVSDIKYEYLHAKCKVCRSLERKESYEKNSDKVSAQCRKYYIENREYLNQMSRKRYKIKEKGFMIKNVSIKITEDMYNDLEKLVSDWNKTNKSRLKVKMSHIIRLMIAECVENFNNPDEVGKMQKQKTEKLVDWLRAVDLTGDYNVFLQEEIK